MNTGIQDGLIDPKHERAMGPAIWLFMWLVRCETQRSSMVLGGMPLTYTEISRRSRFPERKIRRWMDRLRKYRYICVHYRNYKMLAIEIMKPKKWFPKQQPLQFTDHRPKTVSHDRPQMGDTATKNGQSKQSCILREKRKTSLPSASGGHSPESFMEYHGTVIAIQMRGRKRLPVSSTGPMLDKYYVEWLNSKGFPARIVSAEELSQGGHVN